jgi:hypothetical protein
MVPSNGADGHSSSLQTKVGVMPNAVDSADRLGASSCPISPTYVGKTYLLIVMNKKSGFAKDVQTALDGMREWTADLHDKTFVDAEIELIPQLKAKYKMDFYTPPDEELAKWDALDKPIWDEFAADLNAKGLTGTKFVNEFIALEKQYSIQLSQFKMP